MDIKDILLDIGSRYDIDTKELFKLYLGKKTKVSTQEDNSLNEEKAEIVFCDGASNQRTKASFGVFFKDGDDRNIGKVLNIDNPTNNKAELYGIWASLKLTDSDVPLIIYSDSRYSINCLTKWYKNWMKNGWKTAKGDDVLNKRLIQKILKLLDNRNVQFTHVNAHRKPPTNKHSLEYKLWYGNKMADQLATEAYSD